MRKHFTDLEKRKVPLSIKDIKEIVNVEMRKKFNLLVRNIDKNRKRIIELERSLERLIKIWE